MIELNLRGTAWACRAVAPVMRRVGRGRIVNITSIGAEFGLVNRAAYCATKGGVAAAHALPRARVGPARDHGQRGWAWDHGDAARAALSWTPIPGRKRR